MFGAVFRSGLKWVASMAASLYHFDWDPAKAQANASKHGVDFQRATEVFRDPLAVTIPDDEHSVAELRWITLRKDMRGQYVLVIHTFEETDEGTAHVRIISARFPTRAEIRDYERKT